MQTYKQKNVWTKSVLKIQGQIQPSQCNTEMRKHELTAAFLELPSQTEVSPDPPQYYQGLC